MSDDSHHLNEDQEAPDAPPQYPPAHSFSESDEDDISPTVDVSDTGTIVAGSPGLLDASDDSPGSPFPSVVHEVDSASSAAPDGRNSGHGWTDPDNDYSSSLYSSDEEEAAPTPDNSVPSPPASTPTVPLDVISSGVESRARRLHHGQSWPGSAQEESNDAAGSASGRLSYAALVEDLRRIVDFAWTSVFSGEYAPYQWLLEL